MSNASAEPDTNEAELQHRFAEQLRPLLPLLPVSFRLERHLQLRLGHKDIRINGISDDRKSVSGRYDLLVCVDEKPAVMAEFKKPGTALTQDDFKQALSYARLHDPFAPLTFVSNGSESHLFYTPSGDAVDPDDQQAGALVALLAKAATLASAPAAHAIDVLLGSSPAVWQALCQTLSEQHLARLSAPIENFRFPLVPGYSIPREACLKLLHHHREGAGFLLLHGPPLSGVTNTLAQLARAGSDAPMLFVDTHRWTNVLQFLANTLSQELAIEVSLDKLRGWLNARQGLVGLTLMLDGLPAEGFEELVDFARRKLLRLVVGMPTASYQRDQTRSGRLQAGLLSEADQVLALTPFTDWELRAAEQVLLKRFNFSFQAGFVHTHELRWPRALRVVVATVDQEMKPTRPDAPDQPASDSSATLADAPRGQIELSGIPGISLLTACHKAFVGPRSQLSDLRRVAEVYLHELEQTITHLKPALTQVGVFSIADRLAEDELGEQRQARLLEQGLLCWLDPLEGPPRLRIPLEELLAHHIADIWAEQLRTTFEFEAKLDELLRLTVRCPLHEITLAAALARATETDLARRGQAVQLLLAREPRFVPLGLDPEGSGATLVEMQNKAPWLVLSHLAVEDLESPLDHLRMFAYMGALPALLQRPSRPEDPDPVTSYRLYGLRDGRLIPAPENGILEPLQQAIFYRTQHCPSLLTTLAEAAHQSNDYFVAGRVLAVAMQFENCVVQALYEVAESVLTHLQPWFRAQLVPADAPGSKIED